LRNKNIPSPERLDNPAPLFGGCRMIAVLIPFSHTNG
jgi:hypothetical protein